MTGTPNNTRRYRTIVADPPWDYEGMTPPWYSKSEPAYQSMSLREICDLPVPKLAAPDAHLYLWAVLPMMADAYDVMRGWGFRPCTTVTWCKPGPGLGAGWRGNTEHLLVGRRGSPPNINPTCGNCGGRDRGANKCSCTEPYWKYMGLHVPPVEAPFLTTAPGTWYEAPRGDHSAKPEMFMDMIERLSRPPYLEMFARRQRLGWDTWGDQALNHVEMTA